MWKSVSLATVAAFAMLSFAAESNPAAAKKSPAKKGVIQKKSAGPSSTATRTAAASKRGKTGKKGPVRPATTWRNRQLAPTPDRYKEIQQALAAKGYLAASEANGKWNDSSTEALRKFQTDQNLDASGKINSLSLIALGLGPKHDSSTSAKP